MTHFSIEGIEIWPAGHEDNILYSFTYPVKFYKVNVSQFLFSADRVSAIYVHLRPYKLAEPCVLHSFSFFNSNTVFDKFSFFNLFVN